jgi:hypothetical protein
MSGSHDQSLQAASMKILVYIIILDWWMSLLTSPATYVQRNIEVRSCNHCCNGNVISITCYDYVFVALGVQHAVRMRHT